MGLTDYGWEADISVAWMPLKYAGIRAALGFAGEWTDSPLYWAFDDDFDYGYNEYYDGDYTLRFVFKPSLVMMTPKIINIKSWDCTLHLFANPGIVMASPARGALNSNWLYWRGETGLALDFDLGILKLGYAYSTFDLYDGDPITHYGGETSGHSQSIFLSIGVKF